MNKLYYYLFLAIVLIVGVIIFFAYKRNYFTKYKYIRLVEYRKDMSINITYIKKVDFNQGDNQILINPNHVYDYRGYKTVVITSEANESINPLNFQSKFDAKTFKSAIRSKLISETFASLKVEKFDKIMMLLFLNVIQLLAIVYLLYTFLGQKG